MIDFDMMDGFTSLNGRNYKEEGWHYRDLRWFTPGSFERLKKILGEENLVTIILSERKDDDGKISFGGQFLISPAGMVKALEHRT